MSTQPRFPFSAVVGQDEARLALLLAAVDPGIGGVLLRGDKGAAKSTLARGLAGMLPGGAPFIELPLGATEDRVLGTLDLRAALEGGETRFLPGLLSSAHGGVLYVDEVNLLPDHLVDVLLDVAASGINRVERDGVSHTHAARFVLVGSMNPEEGELRPQLLDRFGLSVQIKAPTDPSERAEVVRRRLTHDAGGKVGGEQGDIVLRARLAASMPADLPDTVVDFACRLAVGVGAEGLRADLVLCRAAAAYAGWEGRSSARNSDVERVAGLALGHRRRRRPFDPPVLGANELESALEAARRSFSEARRTPDVEPDAGDGAAEGGDDPSADGSATERPAGDDPAGEATPGAGPGDADGDDARDGDLRSDPTDGDAPADGAPAADEAPAADADSGAGDDAGDPGDPSDGPDGDPVGGLPGGAPEGDGGPPGGDGGLDPAPPTAPTGTWQALAGAAFDTSPPPAPPRVDPPAPPAPDDPGPSGGEARYGRAAVASPERGRVVGDRAFDDGRASGVAVHATVRAAAQRRSADPNGPVVTVDDLRRPVRSRTMGRTVVVAVDASGSMGTHRRVEAATGAVLGLLADAYLRRDRVAMVTFRGGTADVVLPPTASIELARTRLAELPTGGVTPLAEGLEAAVSLARRAQSDGWPPLLVVITDGRATGEHDALDRAREVAAEVAGAGIEAIVVDAEDGANRLGLAPELAETMEARCLRLDDMSAGELETAVRDALR